MKFQIRELISNYPKIVIVGLGNVLKGDDAIGVYIIQRLRNTEALEIVDAGITPDHRSADNARHR